MSPGRGDAGSLSGAGLQAERTGLAWSRTALGVAANAVLLAVREIGHAPTAAGLVPATLGLLIAIGTAVYARRRTTHLRHGPPVPLAPRVAVPVLGTAVVALAVLSGLTFIL